MKYLHRLLALLFISAGIFSCQKEYSIENVSGANNPTAQWEFKEGGVQFKGPIDTVSVDTIGTYTFMTLVGRSEDGSAQMTLQVFGAALKPGTYKTPFSLFAYIKGGTTVYQTDQTLTDSFTIVIAKADSTGISGTFSGKASGKLIVDGKFSAPLKSTSPVTPPASTDSGQVVLWSKAGCGGGTSTTPISITVNGKAGQITAFGAEPTSCTAPGSYVVKLPVGSYPWKAKCGTDSISGTVTVTKGGCTKAEVNVTAPPVVTGDYFPITTGSNWASLYEGGVASDSTATLSNGRTATINGKPYTVFAYTDYAFQYDDTLYYRKDGAGTYYQGYPANNQFMPFDTPTAFEYVMLSENQSVFPVTTLTGTVGGIPVTAKIEGKILEKNVSVTVSGQPFANVIKTRVSFSTVVAGATTEFYRIEQWFAKGIGVIKFLEYVTPPFSTPDYTSNIIRYSIK